MFKVKLQSVTALGDDTCLVEMHPFMNAESSKMVFPMSKEDFTFHYEKWLYSDMLVQEAFHMLNSDYREFLLSGLTSERWNELMEESLSDESR